MTSFFLFDTLVFTSAAFWFCIRTFITFSSAVADGKLLTLPITVLAFDSRFVIFANSRKSWAFAVAAAESFIFSGRRVVLTPDVAEGHALYNSAVAATKSVNLADPLVVSLPIQALYGGA